MGAIVGAFVLAIFGFISEYRWELQVGGDNCTDMTVENCARGDAFCTLLFSIPIGAFVGAALGLLAFWLIRRRAESEPISITEAESEVEGTWPPPPNRPAV